MVGLQLERFSANAGFVQAALKTDKSGIGEVNRRLLTGQRMNSEKSLGRLALKPNDLPLRREPSGQTLERNIVEQ
ncbi:MAG: hypothetical protein ABSA68_19390 [Xanthobacteraceae bacterium]